MSINPPQKSSWFNCCCCCIKNTQDESVGSGPEIRGFSPAKIEEAKTNEIPEPQSSFHTHNKSDWQKDHEEERDQFSYVPLS